MKSDILKFFNLQRKIFGVCPRSGELFRLSDCQVFLKTKPERDWLESLALEHSKLDVLEEKLDEREESVREKAREKGRREANRAIRKIDPVFTPRKLNPDDAKVIFHPVDYVVFDGMHHAGIRKILMLDRVVKDSQQRAIQKSIERAIEKEHYEWQTLRVSEEGSVSAE